MTKFVPAAVLTTVLGAVLYGAGLAAQQPSHAAMDHAPAHAAPTEGSAHYLTVNVAVSNAGIQPSTVFVPAGQPVQLMLRNRSTAEHHYRVVGLTPDELWWIDRGGSEPA